MRTVVGRKSFPSRLLALGGWARTSRQPHRPRRVLESVAEIGGDVSFQEVDRFVEVTREGPHVRLDGEHKMGPMKTDLQYAERVALTYLSPVISLKRG